MQYGTVDYKINAAGLDELLAKNKTLKKYLGDSGSIPLGFKGSLSAPKISVDMEGAMQGAAERLIDEQLGDRVPGGLKGLIPGGTRRNLAWTTGEPGAARYPAYGRSRARTAR